MADNEIIIASAVVIPDAPELTNGSQSPNPTTLKRRQSETFEPDTNKRARLSIDRPATQEANGFTRDPEPASLHDEADPQRSPALDNANGGRHVARRQTGREEEKKRGQRMFGALLGTLAGSSSRGGSGIQKRRADIEKRTQAKLRQIDESQRQKEQDQVEKIRLRRRREQWLLDEQAMKTHHDNILTTARFLRTKAEPPLYYKPWDLRPDEEDEISRQIEEHEIQVDRELEDFETRRRNALPELERLEQLLATDDVTANGGGTTFQPVGTEADLPDKAEAEEPRFAEEDNTNTAHFNDHDAQSPNQQSERKEEEADGPRHEVLDEHHGEMMVKTDEDTVIY